VRDGVVELMAGTAKAHNGRVARRRPAVVRIAIVNCLAIAYFIADFCGSSAGLM
jgi:hypothetical protein